MPDQKTRRLFVPNEIETLVDQLGSFIQYWGFKKIHGMIWAHVWLAKNPIDATTLVKRLDVSKALVSLAIKDLLKYDVIQILDKGDRRKMFLIPNTDVETVISNILKNRESVMLGSILKSQNAVSRLDQKIQDKFDLNSDRLDQMKMMTTMAEMALSGLIKNNLDLEQYK
jgi:DNA-binding transcriptional regulator GbsR (MarR family)